MKAQREKHSNTKDDLRPWISTLYDKRCIRLQKPLSLKRECAPTGPEKGSKGIDTLDIGVTEINDSQTLIEHQSELSREFCSISF